MNFWDWPCEMFFSVCTLGVVLGVTVSIFIPVMFIVFTKHAIEVLNEK